MAEIVDSRRALSVNPLTVSQRVGAVLAFLGLSGSLPLEHGVRGCAAFTKLFFMRHFREPIPLQTTAVDQISTVLGSDENLIEALQTVIERNHPQIVGLVSTTLAEFQGADIRRALVEFRRKFPAHAGVAIVPVCTFDEIGGIEAGFARAVEGLIESLVPAGRSPGDGSSRVNILASSMMTPGDVEVLKEWVSAFDLLPVVVPDLGASLDGHLLDEGFSPLTCGGVTRSEVERMGEAVATLVIGPSLCRAADILSTKTEVPDYRFSSLMGVDACDQLTSLLHELSGRPIPARILRQRAQLLDAMVDCQFYTAGTSAALAGDPDLLGMLVRFLTSVGVEVPVMVTTARIPALADLPTKRIVVGDLDDLEREARAHSAQLLLANSHAVAISGRLGAPLLRVGFPQHDLIGAHAKTWIGYAGSRQTLFDISNLFLQARQGPEPYISIYRQTDGDSLKERTLA
jgi:nitrogenase molybdenum-iron protein NifN